MIRYIESTFDDQAAGPEEGTPVPPLADPAPVTPPCSLHR